MTEWTGESTRLSEGRWEARPRLDLVFTEEPDMIDDMEFKSPIGKRDHVSPEFKVSRGRLETKIEDHKVER